MKRFILIASTVLIVSTTVSPQTTRKEIPLDLSRFVKSPDRDVDDKAHNIATESVSAPEKKFKEERSVSTEVSVNYTGESLTNGRGTWHEASINVIHKLSARKVFYGTYRETDRFRQRDSEGMVGLYQPLNSKWTLLAEASASPTHRVLPKWSAMAQIERALPKGWIAQAGFRRTKLDEATVNISKLGIEKYWGLNRAAYSFSINNLEKTGTTVSQRVQYNRYYGGETNNVGVGLAFGREIEKVSPTSVLQSSIYNVSISGRHHLRKKWGLNYGYTFHRQGPFYDRQGLRIGLFYKF